MSPTEHAADGAQHADNGATDQSPPDELPDEVPEFVSEIHSTIDEFLAGATDQLGEAISGIAADGTAAEAAAVTADIAAIVPF